MPLWQLLKHFDEIVSSAYSVSLFTDWQNPAFNQVWLKCREEEDALARQSSFFGARPASETKHPAGVSDTRNCNPQLGLVGAPHERLPHFRLDFTPSIGTELQTEYFVPRSKACEAFVRLSNLRDLVAPLLLVSEIRTIAPDDLWLSPCYEKSSVGIHFTWNQDVEGVMVTLPIIEAALSDLGAIPHWGKLFAMGGDRLGSLYERMADFRALAGTFDPTGKFRNDFLDKYVGR